MHSNAAYLADQDDEEEDRLKKITSKQPILLCRTLYFKSKFKCFENLRKQIKCVDCYNFQHKLLPATDEENLEKLNQEHNHEKWFHSLIQIVIPFLIAGMGMVGAGVLLNEVQHWKLFINITDIIVLVPALLGLKGNLEMTLAARLSTQVNLGKVYDRKTIRSAVLGNFALTQLQSIIIGFLASFIACLTEFIKAGEFHPNNLLIIIGTSVMTASTASLLLGGVIMFIIIISKRLKLNPDNIATPIASSLGDLVTLAILSGIGTGLYIKKDDYWIHILLIVFFISLLPLLVIISKKNPFVCETLSQGWFPVITAMFISSISGVILDYAIKIYKIVAIYQPVINGVGGNIVAIYASRLSTALHKTAHMGKWASWAPKNFIHYLIDALYGKTNPEHKVAMILTACILPGHLIFFFTIYATLPAYEKPSLSGFLIAFYLLFAFIQVISLILLCYFLVHLIWRYNRNPDNYAIPLLTGTGDLLGVILLFACFHLVYLTGNESVKYMKPSTSISKLTTNFNYTSYQTNYFADKLNQTNIS